MLSLSPSTNAKIVICSDVLMAKLISFRFLYEYRVETGPAGEVCSLARNTQEASAERLIDLESLEVCVRKWILCPNATYTAIFDLGTVLVKREMEYLRSTIRITLGGCQGSNEI